MERRLKPEQPTSRSRRFPPGDAHRAAARTCARTDACRDGATAGHVGILLIEVSVFGNERKQAATLEGLAAAHGVLQARIARELRMKRTPQLAFEYDRTRGGGRPHEQADRRPGRWRASDLTAVADAIRENDRFLLVTHENPDGDALGSILAMKLTLDALGKESVMYVGGEMALPPDYDFLALDGLRRDLPDDAASRVVLALDSATAPRTRVPPEVLEAAPLVIDVDHHHDNTRFGAINLVVADASSTGEIVRDLLRELDVALHAGDRRGDLRGARHRHRPLPVREHDARRRMRSRAS